jgi:hypothetical protein
MKMTGSDGSQQVNGLSFGLVRELQRRVSWRDFTLAGRGMVVDQCFYYLLVSTHHYGNRHVSVNCVYPYFPKINSGPILTRYASAVWILKPCQMTQCLCVPQQTSAKAPAYINPPTFNIPVQVNLFSLSHAHQSSSDPSLHFLLLAKAATLADHVLTGISSSFQLRILV